MQVLRMGRPAPDIGDCLDAVRLAIFFRHDAEPAFEPTAALREAEAGGEVGPQRVIEPSKSPITSSTVTGFPISQVPPTMAPGNSALNRAT
jgi:hypothetical protein